MRLHATTHRKEATWRASSATSTVFFPHDQGIQSLFQHFSCVLTCVVILLACMPRANLFRQRQFVELVLHLTYVSKRKLVLLWQPLACVPSPSRQDAKTPSVLDKAVTKALFMTAVEGSREQRAMYWEMFTHVLRLVVCGTLHIRHTTRYIWR